MRIEVTDELRKQVPYFCKYVDKYGSDNLPSTFEMPAKFKSPESFYKYCIEEGKPWNELVKISKDVIL